jgi:SAM-dependent methyltransferase
VIGRGRPPAPRDGYADRNRAFYRAEVERHGLTVRGLGYGRAESQRRRFAALSRVGDLDGASVLDVGAGLGDLFFHLRDRGLRCTYTAVELCEHLADAAEQRLAAQPGVTALIRGDLLGLDGERTHDYVVASGIFGLATPDTEARIRPSLERMFALCRRAVAVNFLSARAERQAARSQYVEPAAVLEEALRLTPAVVLRHDYLPNDFTIYMYRERPWPQGNQVEEVVPA